MMISPTIRTKAKSILRVFASNPSRFMSSREIGIDPSKYRLSQKDPIYALGKHRSNALELVDKQPIIEVDGELAICDGGAGSLGHPLEYLALQPGVVKRCIYCALQYKMKDDHHH